MTMLLPLPTLLLSTPETKPTTKFPFQTTPLCQKGLCCHDQHTGKTENTRKRTYGGKKKTILKTGSVQSLEIVQRGVYTPKYASLEKHSLTFLHLWIGVFTGIKHLILFHPGAGELTNPLPLEVLFSLPSPLTDVISPTDAFGKITSRTTFVWKQLLLTGGHKEKSSTCKF